MPLLMSGWKCHFSMVRLDMPLFNGQVGNATVQYQVGNATVQCQVGNATVQCQVGKPLFNDQVGNANVQWSGRKCHCSMVRLEMPLFNVRLEMQLFNVRLEMPLFNVRLEMPLFNVRLEISLFNVRLEMPLFNVRLEMPLFNGQVGNATVQWSGWKCHCSMVRQVFQCISILSVLDCEIKEVGKDHQSGKFINQVSSSWHS